MRTSLSLPLTLATISISFLSACGNIVSLGGGSGADENEFSGQGGSGGQGGAQTTSNGAGGTTVSSGTGGPPVCGLDPNGDEDGDGFTPAGGDCNDCDPLMNPNALETPTLPGESPLDENCDGLYDNIPLFCDSGLVIDDLDPMNAARAVELCKVSTGPNSWGVVDAQWVLPDGTPPPAGNPNYHLGHGLVDDFGPNVTTQKGDRMLVLSSGTARRPTDPGYLDPTGFPKDYQSGHPQGFPKESPACPGVMTTGPAHDGAALEVTVRVPSNATGFAFDFNFFTYEWATWICTSFNDLFVALLSPTPAGQTDGNISFDSQGNTVTVNNVFLEACGCQNGPPCMGGGKTFTCALGANGLLGTGFGPDTGPGETHGSTAWLTTSAPVEPGSTITMRWVTHDSGDGIMDSTTLVDNWRWLTQSIPPVVTIRKQPQP